MKPHDLLATAEVLLSSPRGKPTTASLCRAVSSTYYGLFHCLAQKGANLFIGSTKGRRSEAAWRQVYRSLDHGFCKSKCKNKQIVQHFPREIIDFADVFVAMQELRHSADYDPLFRITKSEVQAHITTARKTIRIFAAVPEKDRRAFCAYVLLKDRN